MNQEMKLMKTMQCGQVSGELGGCYLLDVRTPGEYAGVHIDGAELMPLGELDVERVRGAMGGRRCVVVCQSGMRARKAAERLVAAGAEVVVLEGGMAAWEQKGLPVVRGEGGGLPLQRQVFMVIGAMVLAGVGMSWWVDPRWLGLSVFAGCGLMVAGATGFCPLALLMAKMPWNRVKPAGAGAGCASGSCCS